MNFSIHAHHRQKEKFKKRYQFKKQKIYLKTTCLNNNEIISNVFKNLNSKEIPALPSKRNINRLIYNQRVKKINNYDNADDITSELKFSISGKKMLQYDSKVLDPERILLFINSEKMIYLKNSKIWLCNGTFKMAPIDY
ncbi:hypothetical protein DMUE_3979 [Dictyocoela muelleri]|nr:hypothetical protein DMUE_3979 [Dictyocoela muelleri]